MSVPKTSWSRKQGALSSPPAACRSPEAATPLLTPHLTTPGRFGGMAAFVVYFSIYKGNLNYLRSAGFVEGFTVPKCDSYGELHHTDNGCKEEY
ncbi:hypothetical protein BFW01_g10441 [Lasiodiplodia theobromae]|uniref:Uncharacterized protein n=1 Tax=Lasiodiplodia theobromae TaxID=45133 RepID=A0A8H7INK0_9PEZI|nr:hypothetical protein BFW01_g10441 [Lasiodiplodia theobromae]